MKTVESLSKDQKKHTPIYRIKGLDGLRALAATLVLGYHLFPDHVPLGYIGVDIFFVLSGFLITALLLRNISHNGTIRFTRFWVKRFRRLLPAVTLTVIGSLALALLVRGDALVKLTWQAFGSVSGTYNWFHISQGSSYFEQRSPLLFSNMWSLAVEQQFYLLWPIVLFVTVFLPRRIRPFIALLLAGVSVAWAGYISWTYPAISGGTDVFSRIHIGTDTHAFGLMLGATLALCVPEALSGAAPFQGSIKRHIAGVVSALSFLALFSVPFILPNGSYMYPWGLFGASVLATFVIMGCLGKDSCPQPAIRAVLSLRPLVWLGERSYGIYLWHWPLNTLCFYAFSLNVWAQAGIVVSLSILFAHFSYRYVELPIRRIGFIGWCKRQRASIREGLRPRKYRSSAHNVQRNVRTASSCAKIISVPSLAVLACVALVLNKPYSSAETFIRAGEKGEVAVRHDDEKLSAKPSDSGTPAGGEKHWNDTASSESGDSEKNGASSGDASSGDDAKGTSKGASSKPPVSGENVTIIGDSVTLAAKPYLEASIPGVWVDAKVSRSIQAAPSILQVLANSGQLREYVVLGLATNSYMRASEWAKIEPYLQGKKVVIVNSYSPYPRTDMANENIRNIVATHPDMIRVADWASIAGAHQDHLAGDRTHPDGTLGQMYADEVNRALNSFD